MDYYKLLLIDHYAHNNTNTKIEDFEGYIFKKKIKQEVIGGKPVRVSGQPN